MSSSNNEAANKKEKGVVLLTTLLVMTLMATLAVAIIDDVRFGVKRTSNIYAQTQADWYGLAAQDFAQVYLESQFTGKSQEVLNGALMKSQPAVLPLDGGALSMTVKDGTQCLSLGAFESSQIRRQFRALLIALGWDALSAANLTSSVADWQDADSQILPGGAEDYTYLGADMPYRTANTSFTSIMELRAVQGIDEKAYQILRPFLCVRPEGDESKINVNTLNITQAPILASVLGDDKLEAARLLITGRPSGGYSDRDQLIAAPALQNIDTASIDFETLTFEPEYIWIEADIAYQNARRFMAMEFSVAGGQLSLVSRSLTTDARRPMLRAIDSNALEERTPG